MGGPACLLSHMNGMYSSGLLGCEEGLQGQQASVGLWGAPSSEHSLRVAGSMVLLPSPVKGSDVWIFMIKEKPAHTREIRNLALCPPGAKVHGSRFKGQEGGDARGHRGRLACLKRQESDRKGHLSLAVNTFLRPLLQVLSKFSEHEGGLELH